MLIKLSIILVGWFALLAFGRVAHIAINNLRPSIDWSDDGRDERVRRGDSHGAKLGLVLTSAAGFALCMILFVALPLLGV